MSRKQVTEMRLERETLRLRHVFVQEKVRKKIIVANTSGVLARVHLVNEGCKKGRQLFFHLIPCRQVVDIVAALRFQLRTRRLVLEHCLKVRVSRDVALSVHMRIAIFSKLEAKPVQKGFIKRCRHHFSHNVCHQDFDLERVNLNHDVWVVECPVTLHFWF